MFPWPGGRTPARGGARPAGFWSKNHKAGERFWGRKGWNSVGVEKKNSKPGGRKRLCFCGGEKNVKEDGGERAGVCEKKKNDFGGGGV